MIPPQKAKQLAILLAKLAVHYYRPDFTPAAAQSLIADMVDDLASFGISDVERAIKEYRTNPENRFFPNSGQLIAILQPPANPRRRLELFRDYPETNGPRATKSAAQILAEHGFEPYKKPEPPPLPYATDKNGPISPELRQSKLVRSIVGR